MPMFADVTRRRLQPTAGELTPAQWAQRQFTGHRNSDRLLVALCLDVDTTVRPFIPGPPWSWVGDLDQLAERAGFTPRAARPYIERLGDLAITRLHFSGGRWDTDIGRYASQGDHVRWYKPPYPAVPAALRALVFDRDGHACRQCGATSDLTLDHIEPQVYGGLSVESNLRVLCRSCNSSKGCS